MHGTFNGIHLDRITSVTTEAAGHSRLTTVRGLDPLDLHALKINMHARLILADDQIEGVLVAYAANGYDYRITIESSYAV